MRRLYLFLAIILSVMTAAAQTGAVKVTGRAVDPSGGVIVGANVTLLGPNNTTVATSKTGPDGSFTMNAAPGSYALQVTADGFEPSVDGIAVGANAGPLTVTMGITKLNQTVDVEESANVITLDASNNQTALVLKEEDIAALPDDTDELTQYLTDLAGPRAAAAGGVQFIVDGFLGGQLPPKDQIKEIRINSNPFTTEYARSGYGRIEIITKPGTGKLRGQFQFSYRNNDFNGTPFNSYDANGNRAKLPFSRENYQGNISGPFIHNRLTMNLNVQRNDSFNTTTINAYMPAAGFDTSGLSCSAFGAGVLHCLGSATQPNLRQQISSRGQLSINNNNSLNFEAEYQGNTRSNSGVGQTSLASRASNSEQHQYGLRFRETAVLSTHMVHDTRLEYDINHSTTNPVNPGQTISVLDSFQGGGSSTSSVTSNKHLIFGDTLIFNSKGFTLKAGTLGDYYFNNSNSKSNFFGTYTFSSLQCRTDPNNLSPIVDPSTDPRCAGAYLAGRPTQFTINTGNSLLNTNQLEFGAFVQTDIQMGKRFLISPGVRYQVQSHLSDYNNFDPRTMLSYQLDKTTVLRFGAGAFHQNLSIGTYQSLVQLNGSNQSQILIRNPSYPNPGIDLTNLTPTTSSVPPSVRTRSDNLVAPYTVNLAGSIEKSLKSGAVFSASYDNIRGIHVFRSRNINAPLPGSSTFLDPTKGNIYQLESTATSSFNSVTLGYRTRIFNNFNINSQYTFSKAYNDSDGAFSLPANNYDLRSEWGRSPDNQKHHFQVSFNGRIPGNVQLTTQWRLYSGKPYNIATGYDDNHDGDVNDRPTQTGLCNTFATAAAAGRTLPDFNCASPTSAFITRNAFNGPGEFETSLSLSKSFSLFKGEKAAGGFPGGGDNGGFPGGGNRGGGNGSFGGGGGGGNRGGGGGGGNFGGGGGNRGGGGGRGNNNGGPGTANVYVQFQNVMNHRNFNNPIGTETSQNFLQSISAASPRTVTLGVRFNF